MVAKCDLGLAPLRTNSDLVPAKSTKELRCSLLGRGGLGVAKIERVSDGMNSDAQTKI